MDALKAMFLPAFGVFVIAEVLQWPLLVRVFLEALFFDGRKGSPPLMDRDEIDEIDDGLHRRRPYREMILNHHSRLRRVCNFQGRDRGKPPLRDGESSINSFDDEADGKNELQA